MFPDAKLFRDIVQQRSVSRGAQLNRISQSAASQQIQEMERRLKIQLLDRTTRPLQPTPAGKLYSDLCRDILRREEEFSAALDSLHSNTEGKVRIASIYSVGLSELPWHREEFQKRFPRIELQLELGRPEAVYSAVLEDRVDIGLVSYPEPSRELSVVPWRDEPMAVVLPPGHPLSANRSLSARNLDGQSFIAFDDDLAIRKHIDRYLRDHSSSVNIVLQVDNIQSLKAFLMVGRELSILPQCTVSAEAAQNRLIAIPLAEPLVRPVGIICRKRKTLPRATQLFMERLVSTPAQPQPVADQHAPALADLPVADRNTRASGSLSKSNQRV